MNRVHDGTMSEVTFIARSEGLKREGKRTEK